jgi:hypothetical protein
MKNHIFILLAFLAINSQVYGKDQLRLEELLDPMPELDASIPSPAEEMHLEVGERHWYHHEILEYLDALAEVSPRMVALGQHARTYGGRPLVSYVISSPANLARLDEIRAARKDIVDPAARVNLDDQPVVLHMGYSIHGNEPSGGNAVPLVAYYLNAAQSPELKAQLEKVVIIFNPVFNPDGFDRFAHWTNSHRGMVPSKDPNDREHVESFPPGRTNYYWFDLNRDWLAHQHPESQGRLRLFHEWKPNVQLDFHEQGSDNSFFFMPGKPERTNPLTPAINQQLTNAMATFHSRALDREGILYFSQENYDDFFMGKGSTYPDLFGCVGILFEQPSSRGAQQETQNGLLTFSTTISNQFRGSLSSLEATAALKHELLEYQRGFYTDNAKKRRSQPGSYVATAAGDPTRLREFVRVLQGHQIEVELLSESIEVDDLVYPANTSIAIPAAQTQSTFLQSLWDTQVEFEENIFYDVSTWTLPMAFNLQHTRDPEKKVSSKPLPDSFLSPVNANDLSESEVGYLIDWRDSSSPALLYALLETEANVRVATRPLRAAIAGGSEMDFGYGTLFVAKALNDSIPEEAIKLLKAAAADGAPVYPVTSSSTSSGIDLGSRDFKVLSLPKVLIATGPGIGSNDVGEIWHLLDQRIQMPITMVDTNRVASVDLRDYTHVLLTRGLSSLNEGGVKKLKDFVENGGVLWAQGDNAIKWVLDKKLAEAVWRKTEEEKAKEKKDEKAADSKKEATSEKSKPAERRTFAEARDEAAFKLVRGAIFATLLDVTHPIGYGYTSESLPVFRRSAKFMEPSRNAYSTPVLYTKEPLLSGYVSDENLELMSGSASLVVDQQGSGAVVLALDNTTFRAFWWGTQRLLINAIFFGDLLEEPN